MYNVVSRYDVRNNWVFELPFIFLTPIDLALRNDVEMNKLIKLKLAISKMRTAIEINMKRMRLGNLDVSEMAKYLEGLLLGQLMDA
jgi:hypothetical protein